ncbi:TerD family protein [Methylicorpusculum oleiharenae]|uniref:TerD family protein n=1 Tax=Methylicorpusculum oleiharenae TaxID=1338687 RepID=UPI00135C8C1B|nr:TerD family protein [Methylicorpusculum oleiharenae]MBS3952241.1 TerD family protein [Methylomicrobium sp.]MCD2453517.1 TerD family protein [Methylicorpusculum oleiharenae]
MALSLVKGGNINLSKADNSLKNIIVGIGWDVRESDQETFDVDLSMLMVGENEKARNERDLVYYHKEHQKSPCGSINHSGDNRTGQGDGDDEAINVFLDKVPKDVQKLIIFVSIYDAEKLKQNFGQVFNAYVRVVNEETNEELTRYDLSEEEDTATYTSLIFGEIYRYQGDWKFKAIGRGIKGGLREFSRMHGLDA